MVVVHISGAFSVVEARARPPGAPWPGNCWHKSHKLGIPDSIWIFISFREDSLTQTLRGSLCDSARTVRLCPWHRWHGPWVFNHCFLLHSRDDSPPAPSLGSPSARASGLLVLDSFSFTLFSLLFFTCPRFWSLHFSFSSLVVLLQMLMFLSEQVVIVVRMFLSFKCLVQILELYFSYAFLSFLYNLLFPSVSPSCFVHSGMFLLQCYIVFTTLFPCMLFY